MAGAGSMTVDERDAFLAEVRVAVLAIDEPGRGPLALPIWYEYADGTVRCWMNRSSLKARLLRAAGRATITVQAEGPTYGYVSVEGPVELVTTSDADALRMATRYLGPAGGQKYVEAMPSGPDSVLMLLTPEHWRTHDFGKSL